MTTKPTVAQTLQRDRELVAGMTQIDETFRDWRCGYYDTGGRGSDGPDYCLATPDQHGGPHGYDHEFVGPTLEGNWRVEPDPVEFDNPRLIRTDGHTVATVRNAEIARAIARFVDPQRVALMLDVIDQAQKDLRADHRGFREPGIDCPGYPACGMVQHISIRKALAAYASD